VRITAALLTLMSAITFIVPAHAGIYADDLSRCLIENSSKEDRLALVRWLFTAATAHPAVADVAKVSPEQLDQANKTTADLFMRLLTDSCVAQAKKAVEYEGPATFAVSFQVLGQVAGAELFGSPEVNAAMAGLEKYTDKTKLEALAKK
jgi:hypothetical protein